MNLKYKSIFFVTIFIIFINPVKADTSISIECPKTSTIGSIINCNIFANSDIEISAVRTKLKVNSNLELIAFKTDSNWQGDGEKGDIALYTYPNKIGKINLGIASIKVLNTSSKTSSITLENTIFYSSDFSGIKANNASKTINILSTNNNLSSIILDKESLTPQFNKNILNYKITTNSDSIIIGAIPEDKNATISGLGSKKLNYGENNFTITITSESGLKKYYQIVVIRQQQKENSNTKTNENSSSPTKDNKISNNQTSQNTKRENSSTNDTNNQINEKKNSPKLKNLIIEGYQINFIEDNYNYSINLLNNEDALNIKATPIDNKTKVTISGNNELKEGKNEIYIILESEDGTKNEYKVMANKPNNLCLIKNIKISNYNLDFECNKYKYNLKIKNENNLNIEVIPTDKNTKIDIYNNDNLKNNSLITISVKKDNSYYKYSIKILKDSKNSKNIIDTKKSLIIISVIVIMILCFGIRFIIKKKQK